MAVERFSETEMILTSHRHQVLDFYGSLNSLLNWLTGNDEYEQNKTTERRKSSYNTIEICDGLSSGDCLLSKYVDCIQNADLLL